MKIIPKQTQTIAVAGTTYSPVINFSPNDDDINVIETTLSVSALTGSDTTIKVVPQYSYDNQTWFDQPSDGQFSEVNSTTTLPSAETLLLGITAVNFRHKYVVAGSSPSVTFDVYTVAKST